MALALEDLPDDVSALKAMLLAERAQTDRLRHLLAQLRRAHFGRKSEKIDADQLNLGLEDIETAVAAEEAKLEKADAVLKAANTKRRKANRGHLPSHLPREEIVIEPDEKACPCCGGTLHAAPASDRTQMWITAPLWAARHAVHARATSRALPRAPTTAPATAA